MATVDLLHLGCGKGIELSGGRQFPADLAGWSPGNSSTENLNHTLRFVNTVSIKSIYTLIAVVAGTKRRPAITIECPALFAILGAIGNVGRGGRLDGTNRGRGRGSGGAAAGQEQARRAWYQRDVLYVDGGAVRGGGRDGDRHQPARSVRPPGSPGRLYDPQEPGRDPV